MDGTEGKTSLSMPDTVLGTHCAAINYESRVSRHATCCTDIDRAPACDVAVEVCSSR